MRGDLSETSAADACRGLAGDGATGTLAFGGLDGPARIVFEQGRIVSANAPTSTARLGDRLVGAGFLTEAELLEALDAQRNGAIHGRLGALLVERSLVTRDAVRLFVQEQTLDALFEVLRWRFGSFAFQPGLDEDRSGVRVAMPVDDVLLVVERRQEEWDELSRSIPDLAAVPTFSTSASTVSATLEPDEFAVLASVDGDRDVRELAADLGYNEIELARIVYGLTLLGVVDIRLPEDEIGAALEAALRPTETDEPDIPSADATSPLARVIQLPTSRQQVTSDHGDPATGREPTGDGAEAAGDEAANDACDAATASGAAGDGSTVEREDAEPSINDSHSTGGPAVEQTPAEAPTEPVGHEPATSTDESSVRAQRAASMADLADTSTSSYPDILRELREHSHPGRLTDADTTGTPTSDDPLDAATTSDRSPPGSSDDPTATSSVGPFDAGRRPEVSTEPVDRTGSDDGGQPADDIDDQDLEPPAATPQGDRDVSEFLRELSRLAGDDEPTTPRPPKPSDRPTPSGSSGAPKSSNSSSADDPKRRRRGLFGRS